MLLSDFPWTQTLSSCRYIFVYKSCECDVEAEIKAKAWWWTQGYKVPLLGWKRMEREMWHCRSWVGSNFILRSEQMHINNPHLQGQHACFLWVNASCACFAFLAQPWRLADREVFFSTSGSPKAALTRALPCAPGFGFLRVLGSHESISIYLMLNSEAAEIQDIVNNFVENWQTGRQSCKLQSSKGPCDVQLCALRSFSPCARPLHGTVGFLKFSNCLTSRGK